MYEIAKKAVGEKAATLIESGMIVGLGTGTTAAHFIQALIARSKKGLHIKTVASSHKSEEMARAGGLVVLNMNDVTYIDITVDGADQIDPQKRMIKGAGGANVREKILATASQEMVVIADETKMVQHLGKIKLPVEVLPYGHNFSRKRIESFGFSGSFRCAGPSCLNQELFITENGNLIFDIYFPGEIKNPESIHLTLLQVPGVVDTGFFFSLAKKGIIGKADGTTYQI